MSFSRLEHVNIVVSYPDSTAALLSTVFGWRIRWQGFEADGRRVIHVGEEHTYLSLYQRLSVSDGLDGDSIQTLNHIGVLVNDLDAVEFRVVRAGFKPFGHGHYDPGRRFYFFGSDSIEYEVVSYSATEREPSNR